MLTLIKWNLSVNFKDLEGDTPLHDAISKKRDDMLSLLLDHHADVMLTNNNGFNSIHHAALRGNPRSANLIFVNLPSNRAYIFKLLLKVHHFGLTGIIYLKKCTYVIFLAFCIGSVHIYYMVIHIQINKHDFHLQSGTIITTQAWNKGGWANREYSFPF